MDGYRILRASKGIYILILEAKLGSGPNMGPQTDPKLVPTECHNCSVRVWPCPCDAFRKSNSSFCTYSTIGCSAANQQGPPIRWKRIFATRSTGISSRLFLPVTWFFGAEGDWGSRDPRTGPPKLVPKLVPLRDMGPVRHFLQGRYGRS